MDFVKLSTNKISTFNVDYDIELLWYGFKNLISNYFSHLKINDVNIIYYTSSISNKLNVYQEKKEYLEIYKEIYQYLFDFLSSYITYSQNSIMDINQDLYKYNLINTWLTRYNKIDYIKKIKLDDNYNSKIDIKNIPNDTKLILKFNVIGVLMSENISNSNLQIFDDNLINFLDFVLEENLSKVFDLFSMRFNLQEYYLLKNINKKYTPIKFMKFIKLYNN